MPSINHIGIVTASIDKYIANSMHKRVVHDVIDPVQQARLVLLETTAESFFIELIEPQNELASTWNFLQKRGGGFHHLCYEVCNDEELESVARAQKIKIFAAPTPAVLFGGRRVAFGIDKNREIVEFLIMQHESTASQ